MIKLIRVLMIAVLVGILGGCAHLPDATVGYYLPQSKVSFKVIRTVACDSNNIPVVVNSVTPTVTHSADPKQFVQISLVGLNGTFSDTDVKFDFYEDGRLKNVNATGTGQGETILKAVVTIAMVALTKGVSETYPDECAAIKKASGDKPLTLTYEGEVDIGKGPGDKQDIPPEITSRFYANKIERAIGGVCAFVEGIETLKAPSTYVARPGDVVLQAKQPGWVKIKVMAGADNGCQTGPVWKGKLPAAQAGTSYFLPIPAAATFGKQVFAASFAESGALTSLQYTSNTGTGQALNVASSVLTASQGETTTQKVADVKAEADLIAQQQRLAQCLADRTTCK